MQLLTLRTILVATDLSDAAKAATESARALAAASGANLHIVHAGSASSARVLEHAGLREGEARVHVAPGDPDAMIQTFATEFHADVIVLGPRGDSDEHELGGTAMSVATRATVPCLVAGRPLKLPIERVLAPIDLSDTARGALVVALQWASALRPTRARSFTPATLAAMYVYSSGDEPAAIRALDAEFERIRDDAGHWAGVAIERLVVSSADPVDAIAKHAVDLTVIGTRGTGTSDAPRLGSVARAVLLRTKAPVLLVPPAVWSSLTASSVAARAS
jgi:nucleotide-binding universal stress UspA family protein